MSKGQGKLDFPTHCPFKRLNGFLLNRRMEIHQYST